MEEQFANCLICKDNFDESKPLPSLWILGGGREDATQNEQLFSIWKDAFQLFSKLLSSPSNEVDTGFDCDSNRLESMFEKWRTQRMRFQSPCCSNCSAVLFEIVKIQGAIDENMKTQRQRVDQLKLKLLQNSTVNQGPLEFCDNDNSLDFEWENPIEDADPTYESEINAQTTRNQRGHPPRKRQAEVALQTETIKVKKTKENLEMKPCMVLLERLVPEVNDVPPVPSPSRVRKSKLKAFEVIRKMCLPSVSGISLENEYDKDLSVPSRGIKRSSSQLKKEILEEKDDEEWITTQNDEVNANGLTDDNYDVELKSKRQRETGEKYVRETRSKKVLGIHLSKEAVSSPRRVSRSDLFFLVEETFLLYKNTIVEVYLRRKMICKEANCEFEVEGIDSFAFDKIREHITNLHLTQENYSKNTRRCPVCPKPFFAPTLKVHFLEHHQPVTTVCEICWKPLKSLMTREHMFLHKNAEERRTAIEEVANSKGEKLPAYISKSGGDLRSQLRLNQRKAKTLHNFKRAIRLNTTRETEAGGREMEKKFFGIHLSKESVSNPRRVSRSDLFFLIDEKFLLYKNTIVEVHLRRKMICKEVNCIFEVEGIDSVAFEEVRKHVTNSHLTENNYSKKTRPCPICQEDFCAGTLKVHLFQEHQPVNTVCEICWKPLKSLLMPAHMFLHKSSEERSAAIKSHPLPGYIRELGSNLRSRIKSKQTKSTMKKNKSLELSRLKKTEKGKTQWQRWFQIVDQEHLLYGRQALVKVSRHQGLECEGCNLIVNGTSYDSFQEIRKHVDMVHLKSNACSEQLHECPLCLKLYLGNALISHFTEHHQLPLHRLCEICWRPLSTRADPRFHMWLHKSERERELAISAGEKDFGQKERNDARSLLIRLPCSTCGKTFKAPHFLRVHEMTHVPRHLRPLFQCEYCPEKMLGERALKNHIEKRHRPDLVVRWRVCRICDKRFHYNEEEKLRVHMRSHTNEKPYVCDTCGMSFTRTETLRRHIKGVHSTERPYHCEFCEATYKYERNLVNHQKVRHQDLAKTGSDLLKEDEHS